MATGRNIFGCTHPVHCWALVHASWIQNHFTVSEGFKVLNSRLRRLPVNTSSLHSETKHKSKKPKTHQDMQSPKDITQLALHFLFDRQRWELPIVHVVVTSTSMKTSMCHPWQSSRIRTASKNTVATKAWVSQVHSLRIRITHAIASSNQLHRFHPIHVPPVVAGVSVDSGVSSTSGRAAAGWG